MAFYETAQEIEAEQLRIEQKIEALKAFMQSDMWLMLMREQRESLWKQLRAMPSTKAKPLKRLLPPAIWQPIQQQAKKE